MKKFSILSFALLALLGFSLSSCSNDDPEPKREAQVFTDATGLTLSYNGNPVIGKTVTFTPDQKDANKGTLLINSVFNPNAIPGLPEGLATELPGPGVLPGSPDTSIEISLDGKGAFSGNAESEYVTYKYAGTLDSKTLKLDITEAKLKDTAIVGVWGLPPYVADEWTGEISSTPIYAVWESTADIDFLGSPNKPQAILNLLMAMPLLNDMTARIPDALLAALKNINFQDDGNVIASYADIDASDLGAGKEFTYQNSPANLAQYVLLPGNNMRFFLNPQAIAQFEAEKATKADGDTPIVDINNLLGNVMAQVSPMLSAGVPMRYALDGNGLRVYLDTEVLLPLLKQNVLPLLRDEKVINALVALVSADESMGFIAALLPGMLKSVGDVIEGTTKLEIGLNLTK